MSYEIKSPLPGSILEVNVTEGQKLEEGQTAVIIEAMKMENEIPADFAGTVKKVAVEKGQTVKAGQTLVEVE